MWFNQKRQGALGVIKEEEEMNMNDNEGVM